MQAEWMRSPVVDPYDWPQGQTDSHRDAMPDKANDKSNDKAQDPRFVVTPPDYGAGYPGTPAATAIKRDGRCLPMGPERPECVNKHCRVF